MSWQQIDQAATRLDRERDETRDAALLNAPATQTTGPWACVPCQGSGEVIVRGCHHSGNCPCGGIEVECDACNGTRERLCDGCGKFAAMEVFDDDYLCTACADEERRVTGQEAVE